MLGRGFIEFESANRTILGIEVVSMLKKNELLNPKSLIYKSFISLVFLKKISLKLYAHF